MIQKPHSYLRFLIPLSLCLTPEGGCQAFVSLPELAHGIGLELKAAEQYFKQDMLALVEANPHGVHIQGPEEPATDQHPVSLAPLAAAQFLLLISKQETSIAAIKAETLAEQLNLFNAKFSPVAENEDQDPMALDELGAKANTVIEAVKIIGDTFFPPQPPQTTPEEQSPFEPQAERVPSKEELEQIENKEKSDRAAYKLDNAFNRLLSVLRQANEVAGLPLAENAKQTPLAAKAQGMLSTLLDEFDAEYRAAKEVRAQLPDCEPLTRARVRARRFVA